jgi:hypothetical protein
MYWTIAQSVEPCDGQTNYVAGVIKFKLLGPETSNGLITNVKTVVEIRMSHS